MFWPKHASFSLLTCRRACNRSHASNACRRERAQAFRLVTCASAPSCFLPRQQLPADAPPRCAPQPPPLCPRKLSTRCNTVAARISSVRAHCDPSFEPRGCAHERQNAQDKNRRRWREFGMARALTSTFVSALSPRLQDNGVFLWEIGNISYRYVKNTQK